MSQSIFHDAVADDAGFYQQARLNPDRVALITPDGTEITFAELAHRANQVSNLLRASGVSAGDVVASLQLNSAEHFEVAFGALQIGAYFVPVNTHLTPAELDYILTDSQAKVFVASGELADKIAADVTIPATSFRVGGAQGNWQDFHASRDASDSAAPADRISGLVMCYTSGTTGKPKGVKREIAPVTPELVALGTATHMQRFSIGNSGVHLLFSPIYHAAPGNNTTAALHLGHTIVIMERFDPEALLATIEKYGVNSMSAVSTQLHRLYSLPEEVKSKYDLSSLSHVLVAGAPFSPALKQAMLDWWGPVIWEYLASTEGLASIVSPAEAIERPGTVGKPDDVIIVDDDGNRLTVGEVGTIYFNIPAPFEYHGDVEKTKAALMEGNYATAGDLGYLDEDGYLYLMDRRVDLIISGGVNVYPVEIENRVGEHDKVADVAVIGLSDDEWGQRVTAIVQPIDGVDGDDALAAELELWCREELTGAKIPRSWRFTELVPRTEVGKLMRRQLREQFEPETVATR